MDNSILTSTKKILNVAPDDTSFDQDIITHINSAFSVVNQMGVGPALGFSIDDNSAVWEDLALPLNQLSLLKTYVFLKTKSLFDPPTTSFHIEAMNKQLQEHEWRLNHSREELIPPEEEDTEDEEALA